MFSPAWYDICKKVLHPDYKLLSVLPVFFVSGAAGLVYQVVWTRKLTLLFGTTAYAISTVLSIFFLGLGVGSLIGGKFADRTRHPLRWYGLFQCIIGCWAALFILALPAFEAPAIMALRFFDFTRLAGIVLRALLTMALLFIPVTLMGTTLPLLSRFVTGNHRAPGGRIAALYAANTFGAVTGCFLAGFVLIAFLGYTRATFAGVTLNLLAGAAALCLSTRFEPLADSSDTGLAPDGTAPMSDWQTAETLSRCPAPSAPTLLLGATVTCGFSGLALEVIWTRLLTIVFLGTTYAYTTMLTAFLCGIAAGGACAALIAERIQRRQALAGIILMVLALCVIVLIIWTATLPERFIAMNHRFRGEWTAVTINTFLLCFLTLFPMTFLFGLAFPLIIRAYGSAANARTGRAVGHVYGANTFGGVCGAIFGGFLLLPILGAHTGILLISGLLFCMGLALLWCCNQTPMLRKAVAGLALAAFYGVALYNAPNDVSLALNVGYVPADHRVIFFREGAEGTVVVSEPETATEGRDRILWINRVQATASIERGVRINRFDGILPLLFGRDHHDVLFMCFGSGVTSGILALQDYDMIDAVEISAEVIEAAPLFERDNLRVLHNPKVQLHIDDGRNFLLRANRRYDVISFAPMPLALAGVSSFYTREYYELCLSRLKPGGVVSQWIPLHSNDPELVRALARTFISVFPEYCAFFINADIFLVGSDQPLQMHYQRAREQIDIPALRDALEDAGLGDVVEIMACYLLDKSGLDAFTHGAKVLSDDRPWAEFVAPRLVYAEQVPASLEALMPLMTHPVEAIAPESIDSEGRKAVALRYESRKQDMIALHQHYSSAMYTDNIVDAFIASLEIDPDNHNAKYYLREIMTALGPRLLRWEEYDRVASLLDRIRAFMPEDKALQALHEQATRHL